MTDASTPAGRESGLRVAEIRIQDLRVIADLCMPLGDLTVLVGENNVGKTTVLRALDLAIGTGMSSDDDLHVSESGKRSSQFKIDVRIVPTDGGEFAEPLAVRFGDAVRLPRSGAQFVVLRTTGEATSDGSGPRIQRRFLEDWACDREAASKLTELEHPTREQLALVSFFLLDAGRDIVEEMRQRRSYWGRLLADVGMSAADKEALEDQLKALGSEVVGKSPVLTTLRDELDGVRSALRSAVSEVTIEALPARIDEVARAVDVLLKAPGSAALPLRLQGLGSRSLAVVMVFQAFTRLRLGIDQDLSPLSLSGFEEPEAHLHPHPQRAMFRMIEGLPGQKIVSTHSPYVVQVTDIFDVRLLRKTGGTVSCRWVPRQRADGSETLTADALALARRFIQRSRGEMLFSRCVILCEGDTEEGALPILAHRKWDVLPDARGMSIIGTQGSKSCKHYARVLDYLGIPWVILVDGDAAGTESITSAESTLGRDLVAGESFVLAGGADFEQYLVNEGFRAQLERASAARHGPKALEEFRATLHGQKLKGDMLRDYESDGWEDRLIVDFCDAKMKTSEGGAAIGEAIADAFSQGIVVAYPTVIDHLLVRVDTILRAGE